jgi:hypothetical protein
MYNIPVAGIATVSKLVNPYEVRAAVDLSITVEIKPPSLLHCS